MCNENSQAQKPVAAEAIPLPELVGHVRRQINYPTRLQRVKRSHLASPSFYRDGQLCSQCSHPRKTWALDHFQRVRKKNGVQVVWGNGEITQQVDVRTLTSYLPAVALEEVVKSLVD